MKALAAATLASLALIAGYVALGGGDFEPSRAPDACTLRTGGEGAGGIAGTLQRVGLTALAGAACDLGVSRERLLLALAGDESLGVSSERRTQAFRAGLNRALDEEVAAGRIGESQAALLRQAIRFLPVDAVLDQFFGPGL
jgi:hypothetical protein